MYERGDLRHEPAATGDAVMSAVVGTHDGHLRDVERIDIDANKYVEGARRRVAAPRAPSSRPGTPS
jgi:hypothetical protein